jgi:hypothetical protein
MKKYVIALTMAIAGIASAGVYEGQIDGDFNGWEGETIYKLMDGHIIQQSSYYYYYYYAYSPRVIIYGSNGGYKIHVEDVDGDDVAIKILK